MNDAPTTLRQLVEQAAQKHDASGRQLSNLAKAQGFSVSYTILHRIKNGTYQAKPSTDTIRAIAWLAGVSERAAFTAAGQEVPGPPLGDELPPGADHLTPKARKAVVEFMRVLIDLEDENRELRKQLKDQHASDASGGGEAAVPDPRAEQKIDEAPPAPEDFDLAAHPNFTLARDRFDAQHGDVGEEPQD